MPLLCTAEEVRERLVRFQSRDELKGLDEPRLEKVIRGISAIVLDRVGLKAEPADDVKKDSLREVAIQLSVITIRLELAGKDDRAIAALNTRWQQVLGSVPLASKVEQVQQQASSSLSPTRQFKNFIDDNDRVDLW